MELNAAVTSNPDATLNSTQVRHQQAVKDEREAGEARREDAQADPGPFVGKVVDISA